MQYEPLVSIIMPTYNCGNFIGESIESVVSQTYKNWELIIVDDCSSDGTDTIVAKYVDGYKNINYSKLDINSGPAIARNIGISLASGKYMAFLDSDDLWIANKLEQQIEFMESNQYVLTYTKYMQIDEWGKPNGRMIHSVPKVDYKKMLYQNYIGNSTAIYNCDVLGKVYAPDIRKRNDYALWLRILKTDINAYRLDEVFMKYRVRANSVSSNKVQLVKYQWELYRKVEKLSRIECIYYIVNNIARKLLKR